MTIHAAKGLEWDSVYVIGATEGQLPLLRGDRDDDVDDEEGRLMYVAVTRARQRLVVTWADNRPPSRYLAAFDSGELLGAPVPPVATQSLTAQPIVQRGGPPARCRHCRRALVTGRERVLGRCVGCQPPVDEALVARLAQWRDAVAHDAGVPGHVVLTDVTLHAIAEQRPSTATGLSAIPGMRPERMREHGSALLEIVKSSRSDPHP